jgi:hypothetical protein
VVTGLDGALQVLIVDHADFDVDWFQSSVRERWRDGQALIPRAWTEPPEPEGSEAGDPGETPEA